MSRNSTVNYTQYVHEFTDDQGKTRFAVGQWDEKNGQYICPLDAGTAKRSGCSSEYTTTPKGLGGYLSKRQALRRARYLFRAQEDEYMPF